MRKGQLVAVSQILHNLEEGAVQKGLNTSRSFLGGNLPHYVVLYLIDGTAPAVSEVNASSKLHVCWSESERRTGVVYV